MKKIFLLLFGFLFLGCNSDDEINVNDYSEYITGNSIATDINFMTEETYSDFETPQTPSLKLKLITEEQFLCANYILTTTEFLIGNELIIRLDAISLPGICFNGIGPAVSYIDLPENINKLTFINGHVIDKYSVEINDEKVNVALIESNFTNSLHNKTFRIPENSFAYVCGTNTTNTNLYNDFLSILEQNNAFSEFEFIGEGRVPYPETSSGHWVDHPSKYFIYSNQTEFENLGNVLDNFSSQYIEQNSGVTIAIYGWNNKKHFSWD